MTSPQPNQLSDAEQLFRRYQYDFGFATPQEIEAMAPILIRRYLSLARSAYDLAQLLEDLSDLAADSDWLDKYGPLRVEFIGVGMALGAVVEALSFGDDESLAPRFARLRPYIKHVEFLETLSKFRAGQDVDWVSVAKALEMITPSFPPGPFYSEFLGTDRESR